MVETALAMQPLLNNALKGDNLDKGVLSVLLLALLTCNTDSLYFDLLNLSERGGSLFWQPWHRFPGLGGRTGDFSSRTE